MIKYFTIEDLLKHYLQKKFHILTLLNQSQKSCADLLLRQYHLAYALYASIYFLVK